MRTIIFIFKIKSILFLSMSIIKINKNQDAKQEIQNMIIAKK